jgi:hypothetical protein
MPSPMLLKGNDNIQLCDKYLGIKINEDRRHDSRIQKRINLGQYAILIMNGMLQDKGVARQTKKNIYKTIIKNIVLYGSELWHFRKKTSYWQ